jgi:hypothetical protein
MAESSQPVKDRFGYVVAAVTTLVAVVSLYYSYVQADVARKGLELAWGEKNAKVQRQIADLEKTLAGQPRAGDLAEVLARFAEVQAVLADLQQDTAAAGPDKARAEWEKRLADLQEALAKLRRDQEDKDKEIASLRNEIAGLKATQAWSQLPALSQRTFDRSLSGLDRYLNQQAGPVPLLTPPLGLAWNFPPAAPEPEKPSLWASLWEAVKKNPGTAVFWGIVALGLAVKIFGK